MHCPHCVMFKKFHVKHYILEAVVHFLDQCSKILFASERENRKKVHAKLFWKGPFTLTVCSRWLDHLMTPKNATFGQDKKAEHKLFPMHILLFSQNVYKDNCSVICKSDSFDNRKLFHFSLKNLKRSTYIFPTVHCVFPFFFENPSFYRPKYWRATEPFNLFFVHAFLKSQKPIISEFYSRAYDMLHISAGTYTFQLLYLVQKLLSTWSIHCLTCFQNNRDGFCKNPWSKNILPTHILCKLVQQGIFRKVSNAKSHLKLMFGT